MRSMSVESSPLTVQESIEKINQICRTNKESIENKRDDDCESRLKMRAGRLKVPL
jgi:hypothetical protein